MPPVGFEPIISAGERPKTYALERAATGTGRLETLPCLNKWFYLGADKSLARPTSRCILFDGQNISFDASLVMYI
jgi:hypothetical protein